MNLATDLFYIFRLILEMEYPNRSDSIVYFDTAGRSVLPASVEAAGLKAIQQKSQPWSGVGSESDIEDVRHMFADLIGCTDSRCIALNPSTGFAMSLVAKNVVDNGILTIDKKVILLDKEMGSVVYPWQDACKKVGARIKIVQDPLLTHSVGLSWTDAVVAAIDESVAVVALPAVHWCNGAKINLKDVATALLKYPKATRPLLVVDGTQSIGAQAFNVCEIDAAFVACSVHKWLNCPYGMSLVYIHPAYHSTWLPLDQHERGRVGSNEEGWDEVIFMDKETGFYPSALFPDARRFDAGGKPNPVTIPMVRAGLHTVLKWGPAFVESRTAVLTDSITKQLCDLYAGNVIVRPKEGRSAHIFGIRFHPQSLLHSSVPLMTLNAELKKNGVYASVRGEWLRISVYLFNTAGEVNRFVSIFVHIVRAMVSVNAPLDTKRDTTKRVLVTGAAGWLGQFVTHSLLNTISPVPLYNIANNKDNEDKGGITSNDGDDAIPRIVQHQHLDVFAAYSRAVPHWVPETRRVHLDLSDTASVRSAIETVRPDIIIHTAALSAPMVCHKDARDAYAVNSPVALIDVVQELVPECLFLFTSTDMVYDGEHAPYKPTALNSNTSAADPTPVNVYGETKLAFERQVLRLKYGTVLRLSNMIGKCAILSTCCLPVFFRGACWIVVFVSKRCSFFCSLLLYCKPLSLNVLFLQAHHVRTFLLVRSSWSGCTQPLPKGNMLD